MAFRTLRFKLIQEYPGSPPLNTVIRQGNIDLDNSYWTEGGNSINLRVNPHKWVKYWKKIKSK